MEVLKIAGKRGEAKGKGERERYTQMNTEFQRIARRLFLNEQCKEIEETENKQTNKIRKAIILR